MSFKNIIIPARAGSKGWPGKNVMLFDCTASKIPGEFRNKVIVSTDDIQITALSKKYGYRLHERSMETAADTADIKSAVKEIVSSGDFKNTDVLVMLYLTYPDRDWHHVTQMYNMFISNQCRSMLCAQPVKTHPYLVMYDGPGNTGKQVIRHSCYQRQQYPECFELSHYICMFRVGEISRLNRNMYNTNTQFYNIPRTIDVDSEEDYRQYISQQGSEMNINNPTETT